KLVVASHNQGKVREIGELLAPYGLDVVSAGELGLAEPIEDGDTFAANALIKAKAAAEKSGLTALSDDSGLAVDALDGAPGIFSARWAGENSDFALAMRNVEEALAAKGAKLPEQRRAHFVCALCLAGPDGAYEIYEGRVDGTMVWPPRGENGFGYDPVFQADGYDITFGEMEPDAKHAISHRADAFAKLIRARFGA
ncbi:MAG TPA: RdgB/HAM1 family non-canonical purine NTP pyrophosphatase, partial [Rhizobiales bacterium]|nr:RdgB/HAM1 family non-canonical purine NTP pyrophosphatase [Hyphomicrobiales bacterium]